MDIEICKKCKIIPDFIYFIRDGKIYIKTFCKYFDLKILSLYWNNKIKCNFEYDMIIIDEKDFKEIIPFENCKFYTEHLINNLNK